MKLKIKKNLNERIKKKIGKLFSHVSERCASFETNNSTGPFLRSGGWGEGGSLHVVLYEIPPSEKGIFLFKCVRI